MSDYRVLVQARMSSGRLPGKVLAPLAGRPVIAHVLARVCEVVPSDRVVLVTSVDATDDPLSAFVEREFALRVFRGPLDDVLSRFQDCLRAHPSEWFVRVCGDSPVIDPALLAYILARRAPDLDLVTNVLERTFPPGQSVEVVRADTFLKWVPAELSADEREHVTLRFYKQPEHFRVHNVVSDDPSVASRRLVVDTLDDLREVERILTTTPWLTRGFAPRGQRENRRP